MRNTVTFLSLIAVGCFLALGQPVRGEDTGFLSAKGAEIDIKGELELELVETERGSGTYSPKESETHFQLDKFVLQPVVKIGDNLKLDAQLYFKEGGTKLNEVHTKFSGLAGNTWLDVGLYERWTKDHYSRTTEGYPLIGTAFARDDALTVTWGGERGPLYWMLSAGNGYQVGTKQVAEDGGSGQKIIKDGHSPNDFDKPELGLNFGYVVELGGGELDLLGSYYTDELSADDIAALSGYLPAYGSPDNKTRIGFGAKYKIGGWKVSAQYIDAEDGHLERDGYAVEIARKIKFEGRDWFTGITPVVSYGELDIGAPYDQDPALPESWDRDKTIVALIVDLYKNTKIKAEYYLNGEDTGGAELDNNEILVQLEVKF